jgi:hypothetical protein
LYRWELEDLAEGQIVDLPAHARRALIELLDAVVIVDPAEYQRAAGQPARHRDVQNSLLRAPKAVTATAKIAVQIGGSARVLPGLLHHSP